MNEKITEPTGFYFAEKNEDGSYGDPKPMPGLSEISEVAANDEVAVDFAEAVQEGVNQWFDSLTVHISVPDEIAQAYRDLDLACYMYRRGLCCIRRVKRYHRRFVKLHKKFIYNLGGK